jgi:hypothetical protein
MQKAGARRSDHEPARPSSCRERPGDARATADPWRRGGWQGPQEQEEECLFLTNEANMLLKTKSRVYKRSQTKPINATNTLSTNEDCYQQNHYIIESKE